MASHLDLCHLFMFPFYCINALTLSPLLHKLNFRQATPLRPCPCRLTNWFCQDETTGRNNESPICRRMVRTSTILTSFWIFVSLKSTEFGHHYRSYIENISLTLQRTRSIHDYMNIPKIEFFFQCG